MTPEEGVRRWLRRLLAGLLKEHDRAGIYIDGGPGVIRDDNEAVTWTYEVWAPNRNAFRLLLGRGGRNMVLVRSLIRSAARAHDWEHVPDVRLNGPEVSRRRYVDEG